MPLQIVRNDITVMQVDAIVNAAGKTLLGGGGVDGCIHRAAGPGLLAECRRLGGCRTGEAKLTGAYRLPCKYVIHVVGPVWQGGTCGEQEALASCYKAALKLASEKKCETLAFPLISAGTFGYPKDLALKAAVESIGDFLLRHDMTVYLVVYDRKAYRISERLFTNIGQFIDDRYVETHMDGRTEMQRPLSFSQPSVPNAEPPACSAPAPKKKKLFAAFRKEIRRPCAAPSLDDALAQIDESFSEMLLRKIDESGMKDAECYKKANIDRKLFSKIRSDKYYRPSKPTVLAFAISLELSLPETREMLMKAGFALSHSNKFDIIVEYFIAQGNYNIFEINEALFAFDQSLLGS